MTLRDCDAALELSSGTAGNNILRCLAVSLLIFVGCSSPDDATAPQEHEVADSAVESRETAAGQVDASTVAIRAAEVPAADGVIIRYEIRGEGRSAELPTLVFVHGWCCNRTFWEPQLAHFAREYQVVAVDLAGHGESDAGREKWTMKAFGQDVAAVVNDIGAHEVILVGHSMGGPVILEAASILGDKVIGLFPIDAFADPNESYTREQMDEFRRPFEANFPKAMDDALHHAHDFFSEATTDALKERITAVMTSAAPDVAVGAFQGMLDFANERQRPLMEQVKCPIVCINAKRVQEKVDDGKRHAPQFEVVTLPNAGHFLMMEYPEQFNELLAALVGELANEKGDE